MKKTYMEPEFIVLQLQGVQIISSSGVTSSNGIGYGGVDEGGNQDPSVKEQQNVWDEDW